MMTGHYTHMGAANLTVRLSDLDRNTDELIAQVVRQLPAPTINVRQPAPSNILKPIPPKRFDGKQRSQEQAEQFLSACVSASAFKRECKDPDAEIGIIRCLPTAAEPRNKITMISSAMTTTHHQNNPYLTMNQASLDDDLDDESMDEPGYLAKLKGIVPEHYHDQLLAFSRRQADKLPPHRSYDHSISLIPGAQPNFGRLYPLSETESAAMRSWLNENLQSGKFRPSSSPWGAPVLFVRKKDETLRLCVDYRALNSVTVKNRLALPLTSDILDRLAAANLFTRLDLRGAYNLLRVRDEDVPKTAFRTKYGHFESLFMPFGLTNAPATFQHFVNDIFRDLLDVHVIVFLDDILVFSKDRDEHRRVVREVLQRLTRHSLYAKAEKCDFEATSTTYLGYIISGDGISMDPAKVESVVTWPRPTTVRELQSFLGFANFYRRFIHGYSRITRPLTNLLKKGSSFKWSIQCDNSFQELKNKFTLAPILAHFNAELPTKIETDASDGAIAGILSQQHTDKRWRPVAFHSRKLSSPELNYTIGEKELLPIVECLQVWRHYAESVSSITVFTDHANLVTIKEPRVLNRRQTRWRTILSQYDLKFQHLPGSSNTAADALSRRSDLKEGTAARQQAPERLVNLDATMQLTSFLDRIRAKVDYEAEQKAKAKHEQEPKGKSSSAKGSEKGIIVEPQ